MLYEVITQLLGFEAVGAFGAALIALIVNTTAYNAETLRGGIGAVDRGQWDAAAAIGMTRGKILRRIIRITSYNVCYTKLLRLVKAILAVATVPIMLGDGHDFVRQGGHQHLVFIFSYPVLMIDKGQS